MDTLGKSSEAAVYALGFIGSLILFALSYQLLLHPLNNYPGPLIAKFTDGYGGYHAVKKRLHLATYFDHLKYGPVYRQAPNRLVFNTSSALRAIYLHPSINKAHIYAHTQFNPQINIFGTLERERHRQKRKIYGKVLSERSLRSFEPTMNREIDVFLKLLLDTKNEVVNMSPLCERLTTDVAGQLAFGQPLDTQTEERNRAFPRAMISMNGLVSIFMAWPIMSKTWPLLRRLNQKNGVAFSKSIQSIIQKRVALPQDAKHDFYSIAGGEVGEGIESLGRSELWAEAVFFIPAGGTTLSAALSSLFFYLSRHPTAYTLLATEIRDTFSSGLDIKSGAQLSSCKYLRACIDETLRMSPPFLATFWREPYSDHTEPFVVDGHVIPRGTMVGVNPYCVMHNEEYFPEPFAFRPERWLSSEEGSFRQQLTSHLLNSTPKDEQNLASMRAAFAPFALGDTGCLGKAMAYHETSLAIAKTLWYFDFEKASGEAGKLGEGQPGNMNGRDRVDEYQLLDLAVADHDGPNLVFAPREEYWRELSDGGLKV
ncbi:putative cytochrome p450 family protein [Botrytis fragariae]|uniref:Putative cytochrome p450 family protein n=1 Tax=Botrytis fragariae TaxID=1964551 RepID=A0A8H6AM27_9HELO|nr:putative cytochrome p450 family protein [Botrytis fragariae]KAF5870082.1 putative cytochrome p450 family protein [Botrytis fragariae]